MSNDIYPWPPPFVEVDTQSQPALDEVINFPKITYSPKCTFRILPLKADEIIKGSHVPIDIGPSDIRFFGGEQDLITFYDFPYNFVGFYAIQFYDSIKDEHGFMQSFWPYRLIGPKFPGIEFTRQVEPLPLP